MYLGAGPSAVVSLRRTVFGTAVHGCVAGVMNTCSGVRARRVTEPTAELSCEMSIVAKAAGIGDLAQRPSLARTAIQKVRGVIHTKRIDELEARGLALREEFVDIAQLDPRVGRQLARAEVRIGKTVPDDAVNASEQLVRRTRAGPRIGHE